MKSRSKSKNKNKSLSETTDNSQKIFFVFFTISFFLHVLFFCSLIFFHDFKQAKPMPPVIQIDLVSFAPELATAPEEPAKVIDDTNKDAIPVKATTIKKIKRKTPTIKPEISLKTKPKNLKDLIARQEEKKKEPVKKPEKKKPLKKEEPEEAPDQDQDKKEAKEQREEKIEDQMPNKIAEALSRLQKKVKEQGATKVGDAKGKSVGSGIKVASPIRLYQEVMKYSFQQNWAFNETLAGMEQDLEVRILIKILKSGEIRDIIYETKSGNRYLDESAKKAIQKANPLPGLPSDMHSYDVVVIFTPKGLK